MVGFVSKVALGVAIAAALVTGSAADGPGSTDWPSTNYGQTANRYSPLEQITAGNVRTLKQVWSFHLKPAGFDGGMREDEAIPIVIGNTMYLGSPYGAVHALDATTGAEKWKVQLPGTDRPSKRGVAYWPGSGSMPPSIIFGTLSGWLYSVTASDGTPNAAFGQNGVITLKTPEVMQTGMEASYSLLSSATIYKNLIIIGAGTGEGAGGSNAGTGPAGDTRAFDAMTGKLVWTFHTVPRPGEFGYDTWKENSAKNRSGVNVWGYMSLDVERGILYMPIGAPNNDRVGVDRPGNNLFSSSVVAADANTGKYLWHFQVVHHDIWDYDTQSAPLLVDLQRDGKTVPAVIISTKMGLMFTLNRVTGKPIFDVEERPVPKSDLPREQTSPTQPFPVKPPPLTQNTISRDNLYKGEPQHQSYCEHMVDDNDMKLGGPYMPIAFNRYSMSPPGPAGGINFWGSSYDPKLHLFISNTSNIFQPMRLILRPDGSYINSGPLAGVRRFGDPDRRLLCGPTPWGELVAVNMDTGDIAYRKTLGVSDMLPAGFQDTGRPSSGGVMLTASGLTFVGGTDDFRFRAFATATGNQLWEIKMPSSIETTPITYLGADGRQFVTVVSTGGGLTGSAVTNDEIIAFALPSPANAASQEPGYPITITAPGKGPYTFPQGYQTPWDKIEITVTEKMSPNLFVLHGSQGLDPAHPDGSGGRAMALFGPDGVLMVDTQNRQVADKTLRALRSFTDGPIKVLVNTHLHSDHTGANAFFAKQGALIYAQDDLRNEMLRPAPRANGQPAPAPDMTGIPVATYRYDPAAPGRPAVTFNMNGETVDFIPMMPSHTAGDTIVRFRKANVIYIEDFYRNFGYPFADQANGGSIRGMIDAVDLIRNLAGPETTLIPGHGTLIKKDDLLPYRAMLVDILAKVKTLRDQGKSLKDVLDANLTAPYDKTTQGDTQRSKDRFITEVYDEVKDFPPVVDGKRTMPGLAATQTGVQPVQYRSPAGVEYRSLPDTDAVKSARAALDADPRNITRTIDLGVAQSGARQFREAIATFTRGLEIEPNNALLLRWRGHRYLSVREFDRAFADLTRGGAIDSTIYGIWYHLGVVQYLRGDFAEAAASFAKAQPIAPDAGELAGSTDWLWMSLSRAGRGAEARSLLDRMLDRRPDSKPVTNAYTRRLQLYRGEIGPEAVLTPAETDEVQVATLAYGLGNWYLVRGDKAQARKWFERSIQSGGWPGFGFIVSEVELRRLR